MLRPARGRVRCPARESTPQESRCPARRAPGETPCARHPALLHPISSIGDARENQRGNECGKLPRPLHLSGYNGPMMSRGVVAALGAALLFGASTPLAKLLVGETSPWLL